MTSPLTQATAAEQATVAVLHNVAGALRQLGRDPLDQAVASVEAEARALELRLLSSYDRASHAMARVNAVFAGWLGAAGSDVQASRLLLAAPPLVATVAANGPVPQSDRPDGIDLSAPLLGVPATSPVAPPQSTSADAIDLAAEFSDDDMDAFTGRAHSAPPSCAGCGALLELDDPPGECCRLCAAEKATTSSVIVRAAADMSAAALESGASEEEIPPPAAKPARKRRASGR